jgi:hypothetical protein
MNPRHLRRGTGEVGDVTERRAAIATEGDGRSFDDRACEGSLAAGAFVASSGQLRRWKAALPFGQSETSEGRLQELNSRAGAMRARPHPQATARGDRS